MYQAVSGEEGGWGGWWAFTVQDVDSRVQGLKQHKAKDCCFI